MERAERGRHRPANRHGFLVMAWLALVTALLCALLPDGPPSSKAIGSAFSPATTAVPLKVRSQAARLVFKSAWEGAKAPSGDSDPSHLAFAAAFALSGLLPRLDLPSASLRPADPRALPALARHRLRFPRAPPLI